MTKVRFSLDVEAWIKDIEVEGESVEDCKDKLFSMSLEELLESGYVKQSEYMDVDSEIIEEDVNVYVDNIVYDYDMDDEEEAAAVAELPKEFTFTVHVEEGQSVDEAISDEITDRTDFCVSNFDYEVLDK